jgi:hypothetical protein
MDIKDIRRGNMLALIEREPSKAAFARKVGTDPAYVSQILSIKTRAEVGNDLARVIEKAYGLAHGWMDHDHAQAVSAIAEGDANPELLAAWKLLTQEQRQAFIAQIKARAESNRAIIKEFASSNRKG